MAATQKANNYGPAIVPRAAKPRQIEVSVGLARDRYHRYRWNGGEPMPGTTSILRLQDALKGSDALTTWAARTAVDRYIELADWPEVNALGGEGLLTGRRDLALAAVNEARDTGTEVHEAFDALLGGTALPPTAQTHPYYYGIARFLWERKPEVVGREQMVANLTHRFGGTFDLAAVIDGRLALIDAKTGAGKPSHRLQLASYAAGEFIGKADDATQYPIPAFEAFYILLLRPDGYELVPVQVGQKEIDHFLFLTEVYHRLREYDKEIAA